ncbi:germination protein [Halobacillus andaensis]|uniref:Germination protein n=1 Tax=Halobacillus andaensis TaxID=1176239 RepID=A0A917EWJ8_HALAA|nr:Ger(x)C family spore germination protein [Halobacillus andaensis]MBP2004206.1 spore germination protein [Halobacillus andaensis]GGF16623.1 germination protein [Halobacillus andaensis]
MKRKGYWLLVVVLLAGCQTIYSVEDRAIVQILGYDYVDEKQLKGTVGIPHYGEGSTRTVEELNLTITAESIKDFSEKVERESSKPLSMGKLAVTLYDERIAQDGIEEFLDVLSRDPRVGRNIYMGIVDGNVQELIEEKYEQNETTAKYVKGVIENNSQRNFPEANLHSFLYAYYADGIDGFLPYIAKKNGHIEISGVALFDGGKFVSVVSEEDALTLKFLKEEVNQGAANIKTAQESLGNVGIEVTDSTVNYKIDNSKEMPQFDINIKVTGFINEMKQRDVDSVQTPELVAEIEEKYKEQFKERAEALVQQFQEANTDPLGLGNLLKNRYRNFDKEKWEEQYPDVPVNINVEVHITGTGISL